MLNEKIEAHEQMRAPNKNFFSDQESCATQTDILAEKVVAITASACTQTDIKSLSPLPKTASSIAKKSASASPSTKDDSHLLATIRGMRVDLAIKEKAMQRLTRELDECKKTMRKLQKERDGKFKLKFCPHKIHIQKRFAATRTEGTPTKGGKPYNPTLFRDQSEANASPSRLQESLNRIKMLEADYKTLHERRLQDVS